MAVCLFFQNKQFVIVKERPEFVITVKNNLFWEKSHKNCNFEIFIKNLQFLNILGQKIF